MQRHRIDRQRSSIPRGAHIGEKVNYSLGVAVRRHEFGSAAAGADARGHRAFLVAQRKQEIAALANVGNLADHIARGREAKHFREEPLRADDTCVQCTEGNKLDRNIK